MTTRIAPWLEGLSETWELPQHTAKPNISSASHDASSVTSTRSKLPRPSSGRGSIGTSRQGTLSRQGTQSRRHPLATLSSNEGNSLGRHGGTTNTNVSRSVSQISGGSIGACGTVQQRSKSASPRKSEETLEWKRRLVNGRLGYGDQTDLFGPSGLENIFSPTKDADSTGPKATNRMGWLRGSDVPMPSSPPPLPSCYVEESEIQNSDLLDESARMESEEANDVDEAIQHDQSFRSNPFDLESSVHRSPADVSLSLSTTNKALGEQAKAEAGADRTMSGQTELEQEDFSPVYVSKHKTVSGQVDYAALDSHLVKQFQQQHIDLRHPSQQVSDNDASYSGYPLDDLIDYTASSNGRNREATPLAPDLSFSENLPTGSPVPNLGAHVQLQRGGYSQQGSFKQRPLSPSPLHMENSLTTDASHLPLPHSQLGAEDYELAPVEASVAPSTPAEDTKSRSSGSPLKLFGAHDTFTSNQLMRRMSQLNPDVTFRDATAREAYAAVRETRTVSNSSSFGNGELDGHVFDAEITITSASGSQRDDSDRSPGSEVPAPGSKDPLAFRFAPSAEITETFKMKRKLSRHSAAPSAGSTLEGQVKMKSGQATGPEVRDTRPEESDRAFSVGKRPPTSPFKDPTPKRRRTLYASELQAAAAIVNDAYHNQIQEAVSSRKRKDARQGEDQNQADAETMAQRKILRPRNPTPNQHRQRQIEAELREAAAEFAEQEPERLEAVMEQLESSIAIDASATIEQQAQTLAAEVAAFTIRVHKPPVEQTDRKRSVTTQDFLNEAMMVMNLIRAKARPQSNLGSVEESDAEALKESLRVDINVEEASLLQISRPPSREGSGWRAHREGPADARVISHLRKFQEQEDVDDTNFIAESIASLHVGDEDQVNEQVVVIDREANVRITGPPPRRQTHETASGSQPNSQRSHGSTLDTHDSAGTSTGRTIETNCTKKSDNVGTLVPNVVAHLIGDEVGGMTYNKDENRWVRNSKSPEKSYGSFLELPSNVTSDDDPFREISDLPVDSQKELRCLSRGDDRDDGDEYASNEEEEIDDLGHDIPTQSRTTSEETTIARPAARDDSQLRSAHSSLVPSKYTAFASSQQCERVETRATSWNDEELARISAFGKDGVQLPVKPSGTHLESISDTVPPSERTLSETVRPVVPVQPTKAEQEYPATVQESSKPIKLASPIRNHSLSKPPPLPPRQMYPSSLRKKTLMSIMDLAEQQSELSIMAPIADDRVMSLSLSVSRPMSNQWQARKVTEIQATPCKGNSSYMLSDLPDFTVHEEDSDRPSERALASRLAQYAADDVNDRYALAVSGMVKILTDVNEGEPYWEDLRHLDLHDRGLASLYGLDDFCAGIQDMNVSLNALQNLQGAPSAVRKLDAMSNSLSSLTSWTHLTNLQYLDISNNGLTSLDGLGCLIHLRELRADGNRIAGINGILDLDGLIKLRLRGNDLRCVDFQHSRLHRLETLALCDNHIESLIAIEELSQLRELKLDNNALTRGVVADSTMPQLQSLSLRGSHVASLNVSWCPNLRHLNVDDNQLSTIEHIRGLEHLEVLSMRRQTLPKHRTVSIFDQPIEARTIYLSGNRLPTLHLADKYLNLLHLEVASMGLQELPNDLGLRMPNLRTLNLNFNCLKDIRPLLNIHGLRQLSVCGNRLNRLRKTMATFEMLRSLQILDLRDNPLTQGLYASSVASVSAHTTTLTRTSKKLFAPSDEEHNAAVVESAKHELHVADQAVDKQHRARLDRETKLRSHVYEVLAAYSCPELVRLDGLAFDRSQSLLRDAKFDRLVELGIIGRSHTVEVSLLE